MEDGIALIDVGSNSVRMLWGRQGTLRAKTILTTQLSEGLDRTGVLNPEAMARTAEAIRTLAERARAEGAREVRAFATEAVRAAKNGAEFCALTREISGVPVDVIDGETEARCGFSGAKSLVNGIAAVLDIGGASVELVVGEETPRYARSLPIGAVRMKERYRGEIGAFEAEIGTLLDGFCAAPAFGALIGIGGTPTTAVAIARGFDAYDPERVHGSILTLADIERVRRECAALTTDELMAKYPALVRRRAEVIPYGMTVLAGVMKKFGKDELIVSETDNLEGYRILKGF